MIAQTSIRPPQDKTKTSVHFQKAWHYGVSVRPGDVVDRYLHHRGVGMDIYPPCLRTCELDWVRDESGVLVRHPAMFAAITNPEGKHVAIHRTFLASNGNGKADIKPARKVTGQYGNGPTIRLMPAAPMMGIAEGIETALSAARLFRMPVWSVICATGMESFRPPVECRHLVVFADRDHHGRGLRAAEYLCDSLSIPTEIKLPDEPGTDWNDVLVRG